MKEVWTGTSEELKAWIEYKREKAKRFIDLGYSVEWTPSGSNFFTVYIPESEDETQIRAEAKCFQNPSDKFGLEGGRISKLDIREIRSDPLEIVQGIPASIKELFVFERGPVLNILEDNLKAMRLYNAVISELN